MNKQIDVLHNLRGFMKRGLDELIQGFRDPSFEYLIQHQAFYDSASDSLHEHHYGFDEFPYEYCTIRYFSDELAKRLNGIRSEIETYIVAVRRNKRIKEPGRKAIFTDLLPLGEWAKKWSDILGRQITPAAVKPSPKTK